MKAFFREVVITAILALVVFFGIQATVQTFVVIGPSMLPNFEDGQRILVSKLAYRLHEPQRGDVVVFQSPTNRGEDYIKRIIALPGDTVRVNAGEVYVNGTKLHEPYIANPADYTLKELKIPENHYFVLGDNRRVSNDSHNGWLVPRQKIIGKAWLSIWPPDRWGFIPDYHLSEQLASSTPRMQLTYRVR
jgi:signal peptidase I